MRVSVSPRTTVYVVSAYARSAKLPNTIKTKTMKPSRALACFIVQLLRGNIMRIVPCARTRRNQLLRIARSPLYCHGCHASLIRATDLLVLVGRLRCVLIRAEHADASRHAFADCSRPRADTARARTARESWRDPRIG